MPYCFYNFKIDNIFKYRAFSAVTSKFQFITMNGMLLFINKRQAPLALAA